MSRVGIFSGTFDPVHAGHIVFALKSLEKAGLEKVYFLPEAVPRRKEGVTHYAHRVAMLRLALKPYRKLEILELPDKQFSVNKTLPRLNQLLPDSQIYMLIGSDMLTMLNSDQAANQWPGYDKFIKTVRLMVGVRSGLEFEDASRILSFLQPEGTVIETDRPHVSSRDIRQSLMNSRAQSDLLASLKPYVKQNWLYSRIP